MKNSFFFYFKISTKIGENTAILLWMVKAEKKKKKWWFTATRLIHVVTVSIWFFECWTVCRKSNMHVMRMRAHSKLYWRALNHRGKQQPQKLINTYNSSHIHGYTGVCIYVVVKQLWKTAEHANSTRLMLTQIKLLPLDVTKHNNSFLYEILNDRVKEQE